jgi:ElaB/YqjD/DUF883 family membrane-anchored ribosome-binding protein
MSAYADLDLATPDRKRRARKLKEDLTHRLEDARERGMELANVGGAKAREYSRYAADHARAKPVSTGLIVAAVGIGLFFLLSRDARSRVMSTGEDLWNRYARR